MKVKVNAESKTFTDGLTVAELLKALGHEPNTVAVAVNLAFVPRSAHATTALRDGDEVEIVEPRQGG